MAAMNNALLSRTVQNNSKFSGGTLVQKELQGFAGFIAYQECFRQGNSSTISDLQATMGRRFFGDPNDIDSMGLAEQLVMGIAQFAGLFTIETSMVTDENTNATSSQQSGTILVLKHDLHCLGFDKRVLVGGACGINLSLLFAAGLKNPTHLQTRTLYSRAQEHMKNCKKALALVNRASSPYRAYATTGKLPSGQSIEDYYLFVRRKMYVLLFPAAAGASTSSGRKRLCDRQDAPMIADEASDDIFGLDNAAAAGDENEQELEALEDLMPDNWSFPGFITFALLGPIVPECMLAYRSELLMTAPPQKNPGDTSNGRQAMRSRSNKDACAGAAKVVATPTLTRRAGGATHSIGEEDRNSGTVGGTSSSRTTSSKKHGPNNDRNTKRHKQIVYELDDDSNSDTNQQDGGYNMLEHIQVMGIANSRQMARKREQARVNSLVINMHAKDVSGIKSMIDEQKFLISTTDIGDESRKIYVAELRDLHVGLRLALTKLKDAEQMIIEQAQQSIETEETDEVNEFLQDAMLKMKHQAEGKARRTINMIDQTKKILQFENRDNGTTPIPMEVIASTATGTSDILSDNESIDAAAAIGNA